MGSLEVLVQYSITRGGFLVSDSHRWSDQIRRGRTLFASPDELSVGQLGGSQINRPLTHLGFTGSTTAGGTVLYLLNI